MFHTIETRIEQVKTIVGMIASAAISVIALLAFAVI